MTKEWIRFSQWVGYYGLGNELGDSPKSSSWKIQDMWEAWKASVS